LAAAIHRVLTQFDYALCCKFSILFVVRLLSWETFRLGVDNLRLHKLRSLLTSLGIIFGVAAVIWRCA
jgi:hypothetical protein